MRTLRGFTVKRLCMFCMWTAMVVLSVTASARADDARQQPSVPPATTAHQGAVLGQAETNSPVPSGSVQRQEQQPGAPSQEAKKAQDAQALFEESLRQMMPLGEGQIQEYRERSDQRERALLPVSPSLNSRTVRVPLEPGTAPVKVLTTANIATSLVIHDSTGQPWPVTSVTNGGPHYFQVLRPDLPDGNLLNVMPTQGHGTSTIVVTLEKQDIPLVIRLESDSVRSSERKADALVLFQIAANGPKAKVPVIENVRETVDSTILAFLDRVPPDGAVRVRTEPHMDKVSVWRFNNTHYIRTSHTLMWPAWTASVNGAGNVKCYEAPVTSRIMISNNGNIQTIVLKDTVK